jgi:hypothetical protein
MADLFGGEIPLRFRVHLIANLQVADRGLA